jgi:SAM-dependent methyltransferase
MTQSTCALCLSPLGAVMLEVREPDRFERYVGVPARDYLRQWIGCTACGGATNVLPELSAKRLAELAAGYYEVDFVGSSIAEKFARVMALPRSQSDNAHRADRVLHFLDEWCIAEERRSGSAALRVLDIGAGTGVFLSRLLDVSAAQGIAIKAVGVEPDPTAAAHLRSLGRFGVSEGIFSRALGVHDRDLVSLNKVLEHLSDPVVLLQDAASALTEPGGVLYLEVPDVLTIGRRPATDNILGPLHHHLYTPAALDALATRAGLSTIQTSRLFEPSGKISIGAFVVSPGTLEYFARRGGG